MEIKNEKISIPIKTIRNKLKILYFQKKNIKTVERTQPWKKIMIYDI